MPTGAILGGGALSAGGSIFSGMMGSSAARQASQTQQQTAMMGMAIQQQQAAQTRNDLAPYRNLGQGAATTLGGLYGINSDGTTNGTGAPSPNALAAFTASPDYAFARDQGEQAVQRSQAAQGNLVSGPAMRQLAQYGQGLASQQFGNYFNRLLSLGQLGGNAAGQQANANISTANAMTGLTTGAGNAAASGTIGSANALAGGIGGATGGVTNSLLAYNLFGRNGTSNSSYGGGGTQLASGDLGGYSPNWGSAPYAPSLGFTG